MDSFQEDLAVVVLSLFDIFATSHHPGEEAIDAYNRIADDFGHVAPNNIFRRPGVSRFTVDVDPPAEPFVAESEEDDGTEEAEQE